MLLFSVCIVRRGAVGASCMGSVSVSSCRCCMFVVLCASCGSSQCCVLHDLQFVNAGRGCNRRPYRRWSPNASETNIDKPHIVQNTALRIATGCTHDTNTQHLHDKTNVLPIHQHLQLHASQIRQKAQHPTHPLHKLTIHPHTPRLIKQTTFNNINYTTNIDTHPDTVTQQQISANSTQIHTSIVQTHLLQRNHNKLIHQHAPKISSSELSLLRETRRTLAQLRTNKSPILISYLHKVDETHHTSPLCPLCKTYPHTTYIPQTTYWTFGCLPREWCLCWSGGRDAWQGCSKVIGLSDPSTATRRRGRLTTTTTNVIILAVYIMSVC